MQAVTTAESATPAPERSPASKPDSFYIPSLDGIRAAAVLLVIAAHAGLNERVPGNFGVTVFFFLSGYLITTLLRKEFDSSGGISLRAFYLRRALRILPPMYLVLGLASALTLVGALEGSLQLDAVLAQALHLSNYYIIQAGWWDGRAAGTWIYWSLAVEEHFYLLFPVLYLLVRRFIPSRRHQMMLMLGLCAAILAWRILLVFGLDAAKDRTYVATDTRVDSLLFGCVLAVYGNPILDGTRVSARWWKACWLPLGVAALAISFVVHNPQFQQTFRYTLQGLGLFPLFIVAVRYPDWGVFRLLNVGWVRFLGVLSYSLYLVHPTILFAIEQWTPWHPVLKGIAGFGLAIAVSIGIYRLVERPCARLRKRLSRLGGGVERKPTPALAPGQAASPLECRPTATPAAEARTYPAQT